MGQIWSACRPRRGVCGGRRIPFNDTRNGQSMEDYCNDWGLEGEDWEYVGRSARLPGEIDYAGTMEYNIIPNGEWGEEGKDWRWLRTPEVCPFVSVNFLAELGQGA